MSGVCVYGVHVFLLVYASVLSVVCVKCATVHTSFFLEGVTKFNDLTMPLVPAAPSNLDNSIVGYRVLWLVMKDGIVTQLDELISLSLPGRQPG